MQLIYQSTHPVTSAVRWIWISVTAALWISWATLWTPFTTVAAWVAGLSVLDDYLPSDLSNLDLDENISALSTGAGMVTILILTWSLLHFIRFRNRPWPRGHVLTDIQDLATWASLPCERVLRWQQAARLIAYHDKNGRFVHAEIA
jgi:poly-beta-1,6-N-acetyl-D-glucosamine biosynthesis protein PgaD